MPKRRRSNNPDGRPSRGLGETSVLIRLSDSLRVAAGNSAGTAGVTLSAWWRQAALMRLRAEPRDVGVSSEELDAVE